MAPRLQLQNLFLAMTDNVYFQPPDNLTMEYPAIRYKRDFADTTFAANRPYLFAQRYMVTVIDEEADSPLIKQVAAMPQCVFQRHFSAENLNHDIFNLYF